MAFFVVHGSAWEIWKSPFSPHHTVTGTVICASGFCSFPYCSSIAKEIGTCIQGRVAD